jgi:hypothetical protein
MQITNNFSKKSNFFKENFLILVIIFLRFGSSYTSDLSYVFLAIFAFTGRIQIIQALLLSWFFSMSNSDLIADSDYKTIGRYLITIASTISVLLRVSLKKIDKFILYTILLGTYFVFHSLIFSEIVAVSILKSLNWLIVISTLSLTWYSFNENEREYTFKWIIKFLELIFIISLPFYFSDIGYLRTGDNFQGILSHPMVYGPTMSLLGAVYLSQLSTEKKLSFFLLFKIISIFLFVALSASRTAFFALTFVSIFSLLIVAFFSKYKVSSYFQIIKGSHVFLLLFVLSLLLFLDYQFFNYLEFVITKGNAVDVSSLWEAYNVSRGRLYEEMIENIQQYPLFGIGFGIASDSQSMRIGYDPFFGLPIRAPVEKGIFLVAVFEEVGITGFILFFLWIKGLISRALDLGGISIFILTTIFLLNMGEATLFSPGGMGLINLILLTSVITNKKIKNN